MPLRCVSDYKSSAGKWSAGEEVTGLTAAQVAHILNDSPASFADVPDVPEVVTVAPVAPPADKIMRRKTGA